MKKPVFIFFMLIWCIASYAQTTRGIKNYVSLLTAIREYKPIEKLYVQTDKPYYIVGDTIRLKPIY